MIAYLINIGAKKNGKKSRTGFFKKNLKSVNLKNLEKYATLSIPKNILVNFRTQVTKTFGKFWI